MLTEKGWGANKIIREFPNKRWTMLDLHRLEKTIRETGTTNLKHAMMRTNFMCKEQSPCKKASTGLVNPRGKMQLI